MDKKDAPDLGQLNQLLSAFTSKMPKPGEIQKWWTQFEYPQPFQLEVDQFINFARVSMFFQALHGTGGSVIDHAVEGSLTGTIPELISSFEKLSGKLVYHAPGKDNCKLLFNYDHGLVYVLNKVAVAGEPLDVPSIKFYFVCSDDTLFKKLEELSKNFLKQ